MKCVAFETSGYIRLNPESFTGNYKIQFIHAYGSFHQRHIWEKPNGSWEPEKWIPSYPSSKENFERSIRNFKKVEIDLELS